MSSPGCFYACLSCSGADTFSSCTACAAPLELYSSSCLDPVLLGVQLASTLCILLFVIPHMLHIRRLLTLTLLFDITQFVHYFKFLSVYDQSRNAYMMLGGRGWGPWSEGWSLIASGQGVGVWAAEEANVDKAIRILVYVAGVMALTLVLSLVKILTGEQGVTFSTFWKKNWLNSLVLGVYITIQDMAFIVASKFYLNSGSIGSTSSTLSVVELILAICFSLIIVAYVVCLTYIVNEMPSNNPNEYFYHANMFVFSFDSGEYFPTLYSIENPQPKQVSPDENVSAPRPMRSNMKIACVLMKVIYPFVAIPFGTADQTMSIAAFLIFWSVVVWNALPYSPKQEWSQMVVLIAGQVISLALLFVKPLLTGTVTMALMFTLIGLGLASLLIELFYSYYKLLPVDLYNTGMKIDITVSDPNLERERRRLEEEKRKLEQELRRRDEENRLKMMQMNEEDRRLEAERLRKQQDLELEMDKLRKQMEEEQDKNRRKQLEQDQKALQEKQDALMTEDQATLQAKRQQLLQKIRDKYKVDPSRLNPYEWDRKRKFVYSNLMTEK